VVSFDPGSHALIAGAAEERRRFLDWGVFHVEHGYLRLWNRYQRALKQRNSLLRSDQADQSALYEPWEAELTATATAIDEARAAYLQRMEAQLHLYAQQLLPELGSVQLSYRRGWPQESGLLEQLVSLRMRDRVRGHTSIGVHRADWSVAFEHAPAREHLSRGQEKLTAVVCLLAQAALYAQDHGDWPIVCLDDLASELDQDHQAALIRLLDQQQAQVWITGTDAPASLKQHNPAVFHVEQGQVLPLL